MVSNLDIYITRNGKLVAMFSDPYKERKEKTRSLFGIIPECISVEEAREERLSRI